MTQTSNLIHQVMKQNEQGLTTMMTEKTSKI